MRDMLLGAATSAADVRRPAAAAAAELAAQRRPQTACVCAQPVGILHVGTDEIRRTPEGGDGDFLEEDDNSDGASLDGYDDAGVDPAAPRGVWRMHAPAAAASRLLQAAVSGVDVAATRRPQTSSAADLGRILAGPSLASTSDPPRTRTAPVVATTTAASGDHVVGADGKALQASASTPPFGLARDQWLLLGGLRAQVPLAPMPSPGAPANTAASPTAARPHAARDQPTRSLAARVGETLPRRCVFVNTRPQTSGCSRLPHRGATAAAGLGPGAARMRSHVSWSNFLPARFEAIRSADVRVGSVNQPLPLASSGGGSSGGCKASAVPQPLPGPGVPALAAPRTCAAAVAAEAAARASTGAQTCGGEPGAAPGVCCDPPSAQAVPALEVPAHPGPIAARRIAAQAEEAPRPNPPISMGPPPASATATECEPRRRRGPKYHVAPGGSRPIATSKKASRDLVVLEFRTEPRVVPASRHGAGATRVEDRSHAARFRPRSRQWAVERDGLCPP